MKILLYVVLIIVSFAIVFHLTMHNHGAFEDIPQAIAKTIVWLLGDLGYDATFVYEKNKLQYPYLSNILFITFATSVAAFIANLLISNPMKVIEEYTKKAQLHRYRLCINLIFSYDVCFPLLRRRFVRGKIKQRKNENKILHQLRKNFDLFQDEEDIPDNEKVDVLNKYQDIEIKIDKIEKLLENIQLQLTSNKEDKNFDICCKNNNEG